MTKTILISYQCYECGSPKFNILQVNQIIYTHCTNCGLLQEFDEILKKVN